MLNFCLSAEPSMLSKDLISVSKDKRIEPKIWLIESTFNFSFNETFTKYYCTIVLLTLCHSFLCGYELRSMSTSKIIV